MASKTMGTFWTLVAVATVFLVASWAFDPLSNGHKPNVAVTKSTPGKHMVVAWVDWDPQINQGGVLIEVSVNGVPVGEAVVMSQASFEKTYWVNKGDKVTVTATQGSGGILRCMIHRNRVIVQPQPLGTARGSATIVCTG